MICKVEGCIKEQISKGYCSKHYYRLMRYGDTSFTKRHGMTKTREYKLWANIKQRCYYPKDKKFQNYGGRGITVCDRWKNSFITRLSQNDDLEDVIIFL